MSSLISAPASGPINVYGLFFTVDAATNVTFKAGSTALSGTIDFANAGTSMTLQQSDEPYFYVAPGSAFVINQSGTANVKGTVFYSAGA
jgi:hypothetical protein